MYDLDEAKAFALLEKKDIFVDVTADWCEPCKWLEQYTFSNASVAEKLNSEFVTVRLDDQRDKELLRSFNINIYPTLLIMDPAGKEVFRETGFQNANELQAFLEIDERKRMISIMGPDKYREYYRLEALSKLLRRRGLYNSSIEILEKQLKKLPNQWETYLEMGNAYLSLKQPKDAIKHYLKAYELDAEVNQDFVSRMVNAYLQALDDEGLKKWLDQAINSKLLTAEEWKELEEATMKLFEFYKKEAFSKHIIIPDFKLEYGRYKGELIQIDEPPTHDSARFWAKQYYKVGERQEGHALDKEFLREYLRIIGFTGEGKPPTIPRPVVEEISKRCVGAYKVLSGKSKIEDLRLRSVHELMEELNK